MTIACLDALRRYEVDPRSVLPPDEMPENPAILPISQEAVAAFARLLGTVKLFDIILSHLSLRQLIEVRRVSRYFSAIVLGSLRMRQVRRYPYLGVMLSMTSHQLSNESVVLHKLEAQLRLHHDKPLTLRLGGSCLSRGFAGLTVRYPTRFPAEDGVPGCFPTVHKLFDDNHASQWTTLYPDMPITLTWPTACPDRGSYVLCSTTESGQTYTVRVRSGLTLTALVGEKRDLLTSWESGNQSAAYSLRRPVPVVAENETQFTAGQQ